MSETLYDLFYKEKIVIFTSVGTFALLSTILYFFITPQYDGTVILSYSPPEQSVSSSSLGGQFASLASLSGLAIGAGEDNPRKAIAILKSRRLTHKFMEKYNLLPILYDNLWDEHNNAWISAPADTPTYWKAYSLLNEKVRSISYDVETGLIHMRIRWKNPAQAASWANLYAETANDYFRTEALKKSETNLEYLQQTLLTTPQADIRSRISDMIKQEIQKIMMAKGQKDYVFKVIDPALVPEKKSTPKLFIHILVGVLLGTLSGIIFVIIRKFNNAHKLNNE